MSEPEKKDPKDERTNLSYRQVEEYGDDTWWRGFWAGVPMGVLFGTSLGICIAVAINRTMQWWHGL